MANNSYSLRASAHVVVGFECPPKRNQWHDEESRAASAAKNDAYKRTLQAAPTRAILEGKGEGKIVALSDARRGSKKGNVRKSRCSVEGTNFELGTLSCWGERGNLVTDAQGVLSLWRHHFST